MGSSVAFRDETDGLAIVRASAVDDAAERNVPIGYLRAFVTVLVRVTEVRVPVARVVPQLAQCADRNPGSKRYEREVGDEDDGIAESPRRKRPRKPHDERYCERRGGMPEAGSGRDARAFGGRPAALSREQRNRRPVIGNHRVQHAHRSHREHEQQRDFDRKPHRA